MEKILSIKIAKAHTHGRTHTNTHTHTHTCTTFKGHFLVKPGPASFPLHGHMTGFEARRFYKPDAVPVAQLTASKH